MEQFIIDNWGIIIPVVIAILSEVMSLNPKWENNGLLQLLIKTLKK